MSAKRQIQVAQVIAQAASEFLARESNRESLITVTRADASLDLKQAKIFFSVLPRDQEREALLFVQRRTVGFRDYLKKHTRFGHIPHIEFLIDEGEKNRQRIDELTRS